MKIFQIIIHFKFVFFSVKPRTSFWNELSIFMESHGENYQGDGRTIHEVGHALGLTDPMI
jgi:hypothetical protein